MSEPITRRAAVFGIATALGSYALPRAGEASPWEQVGFDRIWIRNSKGEELNVIHWDGAQYVPEAHRLLSWLWRDWKDGDYALYVDPRMFTFLANIQTNLSMNAGAPLVIQMNSGVRTTRRNATLEGAAKNSYHLQGMATDFNLKSLPPVDVYRMASALNVSGLGRYTSFTHIDTGRAGRRWAGRGVRM